MHSRKSLLEVPLRRDEEAPETPVASASPKLVADRAQKAWAILKGGKSLIGAWSRYIRARRDTFNASPEYLREHGVSASELLGILKHKHISALRDLWVGRYGPCVGLNDFEKIFFPILLETGRFRSTHHEDIPKPLSSGAMEQLASYSLHDMENYTRQLFRTLDVHGQHVVVWDDFVSFLAEKGMENKTPQLKSRKRKVGESSSYLFAGSVFGKTVDEVKDSYTKLVFYPEWNNRLVGLTRRRARVMEFTEPHGLPSVWKNIEHEGIVLSAEYVDSAKVLLTSCADLHLRAWNATTLAPFRQWAFPMSLRTLYWDPRRSMLCTGDRNGTLQVIDLDKAINDSRTNGVKQRLDLHEGSIADMVSISKGVLVTAGLDGKVLHCNTAREMVVTQYDSKSGHKQGVHTVVHVEGYHFVITAGFENHALVWVENMPSIPCFKLIDHNSPHPAPLAGVMAIPATPQVLTVDQTGVTKIFDIRNFQVLESFSTITQAVNSDEAIQVRSAVYTGRNRQLVLGSRQLYVFEHESRSSDIPKMAHSPQYPLVSSCYLPGEKMFATVAQTQVKLWNADSGISEETFSDLDNGSTEITAAATDDRDPPQMLLGFSDGRLIVYGLPHGMKTREFLRHPASITSIAISEGFNFIASASADGSVNIWRLVDEARGHGGKELGGKGNGIFKAANTLRHIAKARNNTSTPQSTSTVKKVSDVPKVASVARVHVSNTVREVAFHKSLPLLLVVGGKRVASVYKFESVLNAPPSVTGRGIPRTHHLLHSSDADLCCGKFVNPHAMVLIGEAKGIIHLWSLHLSFPVCLAQWYDTPHKICVAPSTLPTRERDDPDEESAAVGTDDTAARILTSLTSSRRPEREEPVVPACNNLVWVDPHYLFVSNDLGMVHCWDISNSLRSTTRLAEAAGAQEFLRGGAGASMWQQRMAAYAPELLLSWKAHTEEIVDMKHLPSAVPAIMTTGADQRVMLWDLTGRAIAALQQGPLLESSWGFAGRGCVQEPHKVLRIWVLWKKIRKAIEDGRFRQGLPEEDDELSNGSPENTHLPPVTARAVEHSVAFKEPGHLEVKEVRGLLDSMVVHAEEPRQRTLAARHKLKAPLSDPLCDTAARPCEGWQELHGIARSPKSVSFKEKRSTTVEKMREIVDGPSKDRREVLSRQLRADYLGIPLSPTLEPVPEPRRAKKKHKAPLHPRPARQPPKKIGVVLGSVCDGGNAYRLVAPLDERTGPDAAQGVTKAVPHRDESLSEIFRVSGVHSHKENVMSRRESVSSIPGTPAFPRERSDIFWKAWSKYVTPDFDPTSAAPRFKKPQRTSATTPPPRLPPMGGAFPSFIVAPGPQSTK